MTKERELLTKIAGVVEAAEMAKKEIPAKATFCEALAYDHIKTILEEGKELCTLGSELSLQ